MAPAALRIATALLAGLALAGCGSTEVEPPAAAPAAQQGDISLPVGTEYAELDPGWVATSPGARPGATFQLGEAGWFGTQAANGSWRLERRSGSEALGFVAASQFRDDLDATISRLKASGLTVSQEVDGTMAGAPSLQVTVTSPGALTVPAGKPLAGTSFAAGTSATVVAVFLRDSVTALFVSAPLGSTDPAQWQATAGGVLASLSLR